MSKFVDLQFGSASPHQGHRWGNAARGFTLIEILITLAISAFIFGAMITFFINQQKHYNVRMQVAAMQENTRTGLDFMVRELSMAGYDPTETSGAGILVANANTVQVTMDLNGNGTTADADENVAYILFNNNGNLSLGRTVAGTTELVAEHISALSFNYTLDDGTVTATPADPSEIRAIDITMTGRTAQPDPQYPTNNGYRVLTLTTRVLVRNMAL
jgi:type IV pilus assembly protein PilW